MNSLAEVLAELEKIEKTCPIEFQSFVRAYIVITKNVGAKLGTGLFDSDKNMEELDSKFFELFEKALTDPIPAWRKLQPWWGSLINLWLGANAHVNYDLPEALKDSKVGEADYFRIDDVIEASIPEIIMQFPRLPFKVWAMSVTNSTMRRWRKRAAMTRFTKE